MSAGQYSFDIEQGSSFDRTVTWYSDAAGTTPVDLTGYTARMKVKTDDLATTILDSASNITLTLGGAAGTVRIQVTATVTAGLAATTKRSLAYDLELVNGSTVTRLIEGKVGVRREVTT